MDTTTIPETVIELEDFAVLRSSTATIITADDLDQLPAELRAMIVDLVTAARFNPAGVTAVEFRDGALYSATLLARPLDHADEPTFATFVG